MSLYKSATVSECLDCPNCSICQSTDGSALSSEEGINHIMACMVKKGIVKISSIGPDGPKWQISALGINHVEQNLIPSLRKRNANREKST